MKPAGLCLLIAASLVLAEVPQTWQDAHSQLFLKLNSINTEIGLQWDGVASATIFANDLSLANSNRGYDLIDSQTSAQLIYGIQAQLDAFDSAGLTGVTLTVQYPIFVSGFPNQDKYIAFFSQVSSMARASGMTVHIECQATFTDPVFGEARLAQDVNAHYQDLDASRYVAEKAQMLQTIIDSLAPYYLTIEMEPVTQYYNLMQKVPYGSDSAASYVDQWLTVLDKKGTLIGGGAGSWDSLAYFEKLAATDIDFINFHIYPPLQDFFDDRAFLIRDIARQQDKFLIIGEAWCYKASQQEMTGGNPIATSAEIFARDFFDYWIDIDTLFIKAMAHFSWHADVAMTSFFWPSLLFGYQTWQDGVHDTMSNAARIYAGQVIGHQNMLTKTLSPTGRYLRDLINDNTSVRRVPGSTVANNEKATIQEIYDCSGRRLNHESSFMQHNMLIIIDDGRSHSPIKKFHAGAKGRKDLSHILSAGKL